MTSQRGLGKGSLWPGPARPRSGLAPVEGVLCATRNLPVHPVIIPTERIGSIPRSLGLIDAFSVTER